MMAGAVGIIERKENEKRKEKEKNPRMWYLQSDLGSVLKGPFSTRRFGRYRAPDQY